MSKLISDSAIIKATGESWQTWLDRLTDMGAANLKHKDIAAKLISDYKVPGWWAQSLTVRYEQVINRRKVGQDAKGEYSVSVSKSISGTMDDTMQWWLKKVQTCPALMDGTVLTSSTTNTAKWRYYRAALKDHSRIVVSIYEKSPTKSVIALQHEKLLSQKLAESWRTYWKSVLENE